MNENRADSFLRLIRRSQRGRLKIYLVGYAAGVGKIYQMLLGAHQPVRFVCNQKKKELIINLIRSYSQRYEMTLGIRFISNWRLRKKQFIQQAA